MVWLAVFAAVVNAGVRRGQRRTYTSDQFAGGIAAAAALAAAALVATRWQALLIAAMLGIPAALFWRYVHR